MILSCPLALFPESKSLLWKALTRFARLAAAGNAGKAAATATGDVSALSDKKKKFGKKFGKNFGSRKSGGGCDFDPGTALKCLVPTAVTSELGGGAPRLPPGHPHRYYSLTVAASPTKPAGDTVGAMEVGDSLKVLEVEVDVAGNPRLKTERGWVSALDDDGKQNFQMLESFF